MREFQFAGSRYVLYLVSEGFDAISLSAHHPVVLQCSGTLPLSPNWRERRISSSLSLVTPKSEEAGRFVLHSRLDWPEEDVLDVAVFKKQLLTPLLRAASGFTDICVLTAEERVGMTVLMVTLLTRIEPSEQDEEVRRRLLPWIPTDKELAFIYRVKRAIAVESRRPCCSIASLCGSKPELDVLGLRRTSSRPVSLLLQLDYQLPAQDAKTVKPLPLEGEGLTVCEFFSGIGGMRLCIPPSILDRQVRRFIAFECSDVANAIYRHNFSRTDDGESCIREGIIEGVGMNEFEGRYCADIWTMSPPCQPYTRTRGARQLGSRDNRNKGIFFLMDLLLQLSLKPRWIVLENVAAFGDSDVASLFKRVLDHCGYSYKEYMLSPVQFGVPNHRLRYYLIAEYGSRLRLHELAELPAVPIEECAPLGRYVLPDDEPIPDELFLSEEVLGAPWAGRRISVVGRGDRSSHCFTKGYGRVVDRSTGSCFLSSCAGSLNESPTKIDRDFMPSLHGRLRLFHPVEMLRIAGFPPWFAFPPAVSLGKQFACIGNSINITVVTHVMRLLFESRADNSDGLLP